MKVTIRTIAEQAGVSVPTVSRVFNSPELVNKTTRERVLKVAEDLHFFPNDRARGLRNARKPIVGVLAWQIKDFFFGELLSGINKAAMQEDFDVLLFDAQLDSKRGMEGLVFLKRQQSDGIIFTSSPVLDEYYDVISRLHVPVVLALTEDNQNNLSSFKIDDTKASFDAVGYLVARGHRAVAMISGPIEDTIAGNSRYRGFREACFHYRLPFDEDYVAFGDYRYEHGYRAMQKLIDNRAKTAFTAVFAGSDEMAIGAIRCLYDNHIKVPEEVSVVGFDNVPISDMITPKLTTIVQPFEQIGMEAVFHLKKAFANPGESYSGTHFLPHRIIERESVFTRSYDSS
nr:LacI family DNA-binding transcriptional regulator [Bacilli bacterium]